MTRRDIRKNGARMSARCCASRSPACSSCRRIAASSRPAVGRCMWRRVVCEDGESVMLYCYFEGAPDDDCLVFSFDLPCPVELFDRRACAVALLRCDGATVH
jgi:hypothetical protein